MAQSKLSLSAEAPKGEREVTIHRLTRPEHVRLIEPMLYEFHNRIPGLRYPVVETLGKIQQAMLQRDNFVLVAYDDERGYTGYLWAWAAPTGEVFIHQMLSRYLDVGRRLTDSLQWCSDQLGAKQWDALAVLEPGEASQLLEQFKRFNIFARRFGLMPHSLWLTKGLRRPGH